MKRFIARFIIAALVGGFFVGHAVAGEYEDAARDALEWIGEHSDYDINVPLPTVRLVTAEDLSIMFYGRLPSENEVFLTVEAIYFPESQSIWTLDTFDVSTRKSRHTLQHELVHHLQYLSGKEFECTAKMEEEAYRLGELYADVLMANILIKPNERNWLKADPLMLMFLTTCERW